MASGCWYRSLYAFSGDASANQMSFPAGAIIFVPKPMENGNGWIFGQLQANPQECGVHCQSSSDRGWIPLSYVEPLMNPNPPSIYDSPKTLAPLSLLSDQQQQFSSPDTTDRWLAAQMRASSATENDGGFGGPILGGDNWTAASSLVNESNKVTPPPPSHERRFGEDPTRMQYASEKTHNFFAKAGNVISHAASSATTATRNATAGAFGGNSQHQQQHSAEDPYKQQHQQQKY